MLARILGSVAARSLPTSSGAGISICSRFEFLGAGGVWPGTADRITLDDLVAVTLLSGDAPATQGAGQRVAGRGPHQHAAA